MPVCGGIPDNIAAEFGKRLLLAPEPDHFAGSFVDVLARAGKLAGAHEVWLQLQRIIEMKKKELHRLISGLRA